MDKKLDELTNKPKQYNKPMDKGSDVYKNKRNVYVNKLNNCQIKEPKQETFVTITVLNLMKSRENMFRYCILQKPYFTKLI